MRSKKVIFITEGGKSTGLGHITRSISIYQACEKMGFQPQFVVNGDETVQSLLKDKNCKVFNWLNDKQLLFNMLNNTDIVFIDSYLADVGLYEKVSRMAKIAVYFDDDMRIEYPKGFVVNGAIFAEQMPYPRRKEVTYLLGTRYIPLRKEFWYVPVKSIRDNIENVMITFGGTDIRNLTPKVLKLLVDTHQQWRKKVIIGNGFTNIAEIEHLKDHNTELIYYPDATKMKKVMLECDIAISAGGQTLYELARIGVPTIAVAVADNQSANIRGWQKVGFIEYTGVWDSSSIFRDIDRILQKMENHTLRKERIQKGMPLIDGKGCLRVVDFLLGKFENKWDVDNCG